MISKAQFGRSMAEMLMVLAIVGILSIAVYLGIHYGLTKADAVNLTEDANRRLWAVKTIPLPTHGNITISEFNATTRKGYPITQGFDENLRSFVMVSAVPFKICQMVQSVIGDNTSLALTINPESESKLCMEDEENVLVFGEGVGSATNGTSNNGQEETPLEEHPCSTDADCLAYAPDTPVCSTGGVCVACADKDISTPLWDADFSTCTSCPTWEANKWTDFPTSFTRSNETATSCTLTDSDSNQYTLQSSSTLNNSTSYGVCRILDGRGWYYPNQGTAVITVTAINKKMRLNSIIIRNPGSGANRYFTSLSVDVSPDGSTWTSLGAQNTCSSKATCIDTSSIFNASAIIAKSIRINLLGNTGGYNTPGIREILVNGEVDTQDIRSQKWDNNTKSCVQCLQDSDCSNTITPDCNVNTHTCVEQKCTKDSDCGSTSEGWHCDNGECRICPTWKAEHWETFEQPVLIANGTMGGNSFATNQSNYFCCDANIPQQAYHVFSPDGHEWQINNVNKSTWYWMSWYNPDPLKIFQITIKNSGNNGNYTVASYILQGSHDNSSWSDLVSGTNTNHTSSGIWYINVPENTPAYKYYRLKCRPYNTTAMMIKQMYITADNVLHEFDHHSKWTGSQCVQCTSNADCSGTTTPVCNTNTHTCVAD